MSTSQANKIELIVWWFTRQNYENHKQHGNVPAALKYLIRNFASKIFNSNILSMEQDYDLYHILSNKLSNRYKIKKVKLLYRASEHNYLASKFHQLCDGKGETVTIIKSNFKNIFGGFTKIPWSSDNEFHGNKGESFLFLLKSTDTIQTCPHVWNHRDRGCGKNEVFHGKSTGPAFGSGLDIVIADKCNEAKSGNVEAWEKYSYCNGFSYYSKGQGKVLCGGNLDESQDYSTFLVEEYEVFEIIW